MSQLTPTPNNKFTELANFQPRQLEAWYKIMDPQCKYLLFGGAAGGGKSYLLRWTAIGLAMYYFAKYGIKGVPIGLFSEDYPTLRDRQVTKIAREFPEWLGTLKETQRDGLAFFLNEKYGGGMILLRNLDDPSKYASVEFAAILVEELTKNKYETFEDLRNRMRFPGIDERKFVAATNPGEIGHGWVKQLWVTPDLVNGDIEQARFYFIQSLVTDNRFNPEDYKIQLEAIRNPQKRKALLEGDWNQFQGQYFSEWRNSLHVIPQFKPNKDNVIVGGMDWGRTAPFAFVLTEISIINDEGIKYHRARTFLEVYGTDKTPHEWAEIIKAKVKGYGLKLDDITWIQGDPAMFTKGQDNSISIADQFKRDGILIKPASNDRVGGWENLHNWLSIGPDGHPYWQIAENCINGIRTLPELVHDENKVEDVATEGEDHWGDSARYCFKALKWINANLGAQIHPNLRTAIRTTAEFIPVDGELKQVGLDTKLFETPNAVNRDKRVGAILRH